MDTNVMDTDKKYALACIPPYIWTVCGIRLRPFSLGHMLLLQRAGSPFVSGEFTMATPSDLVSALSICSRRASDMSSNTSPLRGWRWRWLLWRVGVCHRRNRMRFISRLVMFQEYIISHVERVQTWTEAGKTEVSTLPFVLLYKRALMTFYGYSEAEALDMPLRQAIWEYTAWMESRGVMKIPSKEECEIIDEIKKATAGNANPIENGTQTMSKEMMDRYGLKGKSMDPKNASESTQTLDQNSKHEPI